MKIHDTKKQSLSSRGRFAPGRAATMLLSLCAACADNPAGTGDVDVHISGQEFVRSGWPAVADGEEVAFNDGWAVHFEHVVVHVEAFRLAERGEEVIADGPPGLLVDLRKGDADLWTLTNVAAQRWNDVGYRFSAPSKRSEVAGNVTSAIEKTMRDEGYSLWLEGDGEKAGRTVHFALGIPGTVTTSRCLNGRDDTDGTFVGEGRLHEVEVTLHLDHLFWDDHDAEEPRLLFGPLAYAAGDDDLLTLDELKAQSLTDLRDEHGDPLVDEEGIPIVYVPRVELRENNLREYLIDSALTLGHFNGEGHCQYEIHGE